MNKSFIFVAIAITLLLIISVWLINLTESSSYQEVINSLPNATQKNEYISCQKCHTKEVDLWKKSHHKKAMAKATASTVLGNFNNQMFTNAKGEATRFFKKANKFFINTIGEDGKKADFEVKFVFGFKPLQQYLFQFPNGRIQCLSIVWDNEKKLWYSLYPNLEIIHKDRLHWTQQGQNWNSMCASCHTTNYKKNFDIATTQYHSSFDEINVSCSSCHGDANKHIKMAKNGKLDNLNKNKRWEHKYGFDKTLARNPVNSHTEIETCASCHSRRSELTKDNNTNEVFSDKYLISLLDQNIYEDDGQILDETYVYGSFLQSKMYHKGIRCSDCHNPHSSELIAQDNNLCIRCHQIDKYNSTTHTKHKLDGQGSLCVNCHMTGKHYMGIDFRRDHSFRIPRPDLSAKFQTPNACNNCHTDKDAQWASDAVIKWFGKTRQPHFSDLLVPARKNNDWKLYQQLLKTKEFPEIARATAANELANFINISEVVDLLIKSLKDEQILVRVAAVRAFQIAPSQLKMQSIFPLIQDKSRSVRLAAYQVLVGTPEISKKSPAEKEIFIKVGREHKEFLQQNADFPSGQFQYALYYASIGNIAKTEESYLKVLKIDRYFSSARFNLASLYRQQKRFKDAQNQYEEINRLFPQDYRASFELGLMYYSQQEYVQAINNLKIAQKKQPNETYIIYALGEIYLKLGRGNDAEQQYLLALKKSPKNYTYLVALSKLYLAQKKLQKLDDSIKQLIFIAPRENEVFQLRFEYQKLIEIQKGNN